MRNPSARLIVAMFCAFLVNGTMLTATVRGSGHRIPAGRRYKMQRRNLSVIFVVRNREIFYLKISVLKRCTKADAYLGGLTHNRATIRIHRDGSFVYDPSEEEIGMPYEERLAGTVRHGAIIGSYRSWYEIEQQPTEEEEQEAREHGVAVESPFERCGTLEPRGRTVHFVARQFN